MQHKLNATTMPQLIDIIKLLHDVAEAKREAIENEIVALPIEVDPTPKQEQAHSIVFRIEMNTADLLEALTEASNIGNLI